MHRSNSHLALAATALLACTAAWSQGGFKDTHTGRGTYYGYTGGGNCSFPPPKKGVLTAAMNQADYDTATACGAYVEVTNLANGETVVVRIDDRCPECAPGDVDLSTEAFAKIAPLETGVLAISWRYVSGPSTPARVVFQDGSSQWWTSIQVRNHRNPVATLAYRPSGTKTAFMPLERQMYNYFVAPAGMGPGPYDLKITDVFGDVLRSNGVPLSVGPEISLHKQFPVVLPVPGAWQSGAAASP